MMARQEQVLFYQFKDEEKLTLACRTLHKMGIATKILPDDAYREKVGYLLGNKGFRASKVQEEEHFVFPHEVMVLQNIRSKRLDEGLQSLKDAGVPHVRFKAIVTPFNTLWTLRRLCETMQKEHGAISKDE